MDVKAWQLTVVADSGNYNGQPGLALAVDLECRTCHHRAQYSYARTLMPKDVANGYPWNGSLGDKSWFKFSVDSRLAQGKYCEECGTKSIIPPKQAAALISLADEAMDADLLREAVSAMDFRKERRPETQEYVAQDVYRAGVTKEPFPLNRLSQVRLDEVFV